MGAFETTEKRFLVFPNSHAHEATKIEDKPPNERILFDRRYFCSAKRNWRKYLL